MFELLGPTPTAKPVFEGPSESAAAKPEAQAASDEAEPQLNGTAETSADIAETSADAGAGAPADAPAAVPAAVPAAAPAGIQQQDDELEPVPDLAQQLFLQVRVNLLHARHCFPCA